MRTDSSDELEGVPEIRALLASTDNHCFHLQHPQYPSLRQNTVNYKLNYGLPYSKLLTNDDISKRVIDLQRGIATGFVQAEIAARNARVAILQELVDGARRLIQARGREMAAEVPGGDTGLLVRDYKGKNADQVVYKADCALMGRIEAHLREASVQLGQRVTKTETSTFDAVEMVKLLHRGSRPRPREASIERIVCHAPYFLLNRFSLPIAPPRPADADGASACWPSRTPESRYYRLQLSI